jgi:hypothetical protein
MKTKSHCAVASGPEIERQIRYLGEAGIRLTELKIRTQNAKHFIRVRKPEHADDELMHLAYEAEKLRLHLRAWKNYVISSLRLQ